MSQVSESTRVNEVRSASSQGVGVPIGEMLAAFGEAVGAVASLGARAAREFAQDCATVAVVSPCGSSKKVARGSARDRASAAPAKAQSSSLASTPALAQSAKAMVSAAPVRQAGKAQATGTVTLKPLSPATLAALEAATSAPQVLAALQASGAVVPQPAALQPQWAKVRAAIAAQPASPAALSEARSLARSVICQHTQALAGEVLQMARAAAIAVGLTPVKLIEDRGYLLATNASGESLRVDVTRDETLGTVSLARDLDGFRDDRCLVVDLQFEEEMHRLGVDIAPARKLRKPRVPVTTRPATRVRV